jgi:hypothetical protein
MKDALFALALAAGFAGIACSQPESDSIIYVSVTAPTGMPPVVQLVAGLSYAGNSEIERFPPTKATSGIGFTPAATFVLTMPRSRGGNLGIAIDAIDGNDTIVAHGEKTVAIVSGGRADVTVSLSLLGTSDAGVADTAGPKPDVATPNPDGAADLGPRDAPFGAETVPSDAIAGSGGAGGVVPGSGGSGGATGGNGGSGGTAGVGGLGGGGNGCMDFASDSVVVFCNGAARGAMTGWAWTAQGVSEILTTPVCDNTASGGGASDPITADKPCVSKTLWNATDALCIAGSIPVVTGGDYNSNWGIQIGADVSNPLGSTLGKTFSQITFSYSATISPANSAIRAMLHRKGDPDATSYCATVRPDVLVSLASFNTRCWDGSGVFLTADDVANIDRVGIQITADERNTYTVSNFCLTKIVFGNPATGAGGSAGAGGAGGGGGRGGASGSGGTTAPISALDCPDTSSFTASVSAQYGVTRIPVDNNANKTYYMQANWWGSPWNNQVETINGIGFAMTNPPPNNVTSNKDNPMGFPSIYIGSYQGRGTTGSNLPMQLCLLGSLPTVLSTNADKLGWSSYNAAYDVWLTQGSSPLGSSASSPCPGAYLMVWLFKPTDKQPRGSVLVDGRAIDGVPGAWTVWVDSSTASCPAVTYVSTTRLASLEVDLNLFLQDAVANKYGSITSSLYLSTIFAGFEVWGGGDGLQLTKFCANVKQCNPCPICPVN